MNRAKRLLALDVGEKRIGIAQADTQVRIALPYDTVEVDGNEIQAITELVLSEKIDIIVIGYPRNQSGETTAQTAKVEEFADKLRLLDARIVFQDESLTSVLAEKHLASRKQPYSKADVDAFAASIILEDYLEQQS